MAQRVSPDEPIRRFHDLCIGAVILLHEQHLRPRMVLFKRKQRPGAGRPESVDTLVLIPHHEQIVILPCQTPDDGMLDHGGVLGFVHTQIGVLVLKILQRLGTFTQNRIRIYHLIVIIHQSPAPKLSAVGAVDLRYFIIPLRLQPADFLLPEHAVLDIGDEGSDIFQIALRGVVPLRPLINPG